MDGYVDNIRSLISKYGNDEKTLLKENPSLENLYTFSSQTKSCLEFIDFEPDDEVLLLGSKFLAQIDLLLARCKKVSVFENDILWQEVLKEKFKDEKLEIITGSLADIRERYSKICIIGSLTDEYAKQIQALKANLKDDGSRLIIACDNSYGIKYLAGAIKDEYSFSLEEISSYLSNEKFDFEVFYPFPDYKLATSIYTDSYLPKKGELSSDVPAYNYPKYGENKLGINYDLVCEKGDFNKFSNSFIFVTGKSLGVEYVRYNRNRKDEFKIKTCIMKDDDKRIVRKEALLDAGKTHIKNIISNYDVVSRENENISYTEPIIIDEKTLEFEFIGGESLSEYIISKIKDSNSLVYELNKIINTIIKDGTRNIDATLDNFIVQDGRIIGIDYEWLSDNEEDKKYSTFRILENFYAKYSEKIAYSYNEFLALFNINSFEIQEFKKKELDFQEYVHGEIQKIYLDNYFIEYKTRKDLERKYSEGDLQGEKPETILNEIKNKTEAFSKMLEIKRMTDNHVNNLSLIIENLRRENADLNSKIAGLPTAQKDPTFRNFLHYKFDSYFPAGSRKRKVFRYLKIALKTPKRMLKMLSSDIERNRILGDFKIGDSYIEHGKLIFKKEESPLVSIIIPCYNQIDYTYACLISILENTKDVSYEVIIADDVSKDATKDLEKFSENLIIARNSSNQGFLRNCNNAAKKAKGKYILFLNNDTKVTKNWLSSLVDLMERDTDIGMAGSKLIYPDGRLQEAGGIIWKDGSGCNYGKFDDKDKSEYNYVKECDYISGASIIIRKSLWEEIGGFDERFSPAYCEDSDFAFEVRKRGKKVVYQPASVVVHFEGISNGTDINGSGLKRYQVENSIKLKEKWQAEFENQFDNTSKNIFRARERSKGKKIILFIDHYVPTYDKDAGSKTTLQYLKMLVNKGYIIKFIGDDFLKEEPYTSTLQQMGIEVMYGPERKAEIFDWIKENEENIYLVYLNRPFVAGNYIDFIKENTSLRIIYYGHDLHFLREQREYELTGNIDNKASSEYWKNIELDIMRKADLSYYPSIVETKFIETIDNGIKTKAITAYVYDEFKEDIDRDFKNREGLLFVGGFAHHPNKDAVLWFVKDIFPFIREKLKINFYIVGSKADKEILDLHDEAKGIIVKGFVSEKELEDLYKSTKLAVVPLRYGAGVKGKVIEAIYYNLPVVTTSVGAEGIVCADEILYISDIAKDFADTVIDLYKKDDILMSISLAEDKYIRRYNSIDAVWDIIKEDF